ncbi:MAG: hypothetical protein HY553_08440, partial [Elusimicrobia bacterium]|nr:hypothetical protein [Elusimicrobiota bacterium]
EESQKLEAAFKEKRKKLRPLQRELRDAVLKLRDQVEDEADDKALTATLERVEKAKLALDDARHKFHKRLGDMLPPASRAKLVLAHARKKMRGHAMAMGGGPGMGHGPWKKMKMKFKRMRHGGPEDGPPSPPDHDDDDEDEKED